MVGIVVIIVPHFHSLLTKGKFKLSTAWLEQKQRRKPWKLRPRSGTFLGFFRSVLDQRLTGPVVTSAFGQYTWFPFKKAFVHFPAS